MSLRCISARCNIDLPPNHYVYWYLKINYLLIYKFLRELFNVTWKMEPSFSCFHFNDWHVSLTLGWFHIIKVKSLTKCDMTKIKRTWASQYGVINFNKQLSNDLLFIRCNDTSIIKKRMDDDTRHYNSLQIWRGGSFILGHLVWLYIINILGGTKGRFGYRGRWWGWYL